MENDPKLAKQFFEQANKLQKSGHLDRAAKFYKRSIEFNPTSEAYTYLGWIYSQKGLYAEAILQCKVAIDLDPTYGNAYNDIGAYLIQLGRYNEAIPWLEKSLHAPRYENYCYPNLNLGYIYEQKGDWKKALKFYETALNQNKAYQPARSAYDKLCGKLN